MIVVPLVAAVRQSPLPFVELMEMTMTGHAEVIGVMMTVTMDLITGKDF